MKVFSSNILISELAICIMGGIHVLCRGKIMLGARIRVENRKCWLKKLAASSMNYLTKSFTRETSHFQLSFRQLWVGKVDNQPNRKKIMNQSISSKPPIPLQLYRSQTELPTINCMLYNREQNKRKTPKANTFTSSTKKFGDKMLQSYSYGINSLQIGRFMVWKIHGGFYS